MVTMRVYTEHKDITYLLVAILLNYVVGLVNINIDTASTKFLSFDYNKIFRKICNNLKSLRMLKIMYV